MKKLLLLLTIMPSAFCNAQPTLTQANCAPTIGFSCNANAIAFFQPGNLGANVTWNFANFTSTGSSSETFIACSAAPSCAQMTGSNIVVSSGSAYIYNISSATSYSTRGMEASGVTFDYSNPEEMFHFPFTFNNSYVDSFTATFTSSVTMTRKGYAVVTADAWGKLILPTGTFNNVLRVHRVKNYSDYYMGNPIQSYYESQYYWLQPGNHEFILFCDSLNAGGSSTTTSFYSDLTPVNGINEINSSVINLSISPIPAKDFVNIRFHHEEDGNISYSIADMTGRTVEMISHENMPKGECSEKIDISQLTQGVYLLNIWDGSTVITRKIEIF